jgi:gliding motility-associated protein GldC
MESEINFKIRLDDQRLPESIFWNATESGIDGVKECKATMMSLWDPKDNTTLRIDLWTKDMLVDDMKQFFYENFLSMADTYFRATNDESSAKDIRQFAEDFRKKALGK